MVDVILIADDDPEVAAAVEASLTLEGWDVYVAHDGFAALEQSRKLTPALVILDVMMPKLDGFSVCRALREDPATAHSAVILVGGRRVLDDKLIGFAAGADDYVEKPFVPAELVARVRSVLRRSDQMRDLSPLTRLPGNFRIASELERLVTPPGAEFAVLYADLNEFKAFNDYYGFLRGDEVIKFTARVLTDALATHPGAPRFCGHVGGDDFVLLCDPPSADAICRGVMSRFDRGIGALYDPDDAAAGYIEVADRRGNLHRFGLTSIAIGVATTTQRPIRTQWEASVIATEMKAHAKRLGRSAYEIDRRER